MAVRPRSRTNTRAQGRAVVLQPLAVRVDRATHKVNNSMNKDTEAGPVSIIGAGGHATVVASTLLAAGYQVDGFYADDPAMMGKEILGFPVKGPIAALKSTGATRALLGIGSNEARKRLAGELQLDWVTAVHPLAYVDPSATLGPGTVVCAGAIVQPGATIGAHVILNTKASADHHTSVGDFAHIAVAHLAGGASIGEGVFLALHSVVLPKVTVGPWATVGAGAVVTKDVAENATVVGAPARPLLRG